MSARHTWVLAEEFAFRELEAEFGAPIKRQVAVLGDLGVDGLFQDKGITTFVEIKFTSIPRLAQVARRASDQLGRIKDKMMKPASFILAIVVDATTSEGLERELARTREHLMSMPFPIELRVYDFAELKKKYGVEEERTSN